MRSRSNSGVRLDGYARLVHQTILCHQVGEGVSPVITEGVQCDSLDGDGWMNAPPCVCVYVCVRTRFSRPLAGEALEDPEEKIGVGLGPRAELGASTVSGEP